MVMPFEDQVEGQFGGPTVLYGSPLADLELAPLNSDLGRYFGATDGVLVISVPKESQLGLKGGDVVLTVDGRKPATPSQLLRILRSYESDETLKLEVLRNHKRETVTGHLGDKSPG
jgi:S1-C subfamily serine protease